MKSRAQSTRTSAFAAELRRCGLRTPEIALAMRWTQAEVVADLRRARRAPPSELPAHLHHDAVRRCAWLASRRLCPILSRDDLRQEGHLALMLAHRQGRLPADEMHAKHYVVRRALGAMVDANRKAWRHSLPSLQFLDDEESSSPRHEPIDFSAAPERHAQIKQAIERIVLRGTPQLIDCLDRLADGTSCTEVAAAMQVDPARVSQLRKQARQIAAVCL